jgi:uncharacterized membrane protein
MYRASEVLNELPSMPSDWVLDVHDVFAVYRRFQRRTARRPERPDDHRAGRRVGGLWDLLIGARLAIPFTGGASAAAAAGAIAAGAAGGNRFGAGLGAMDAES